MITRAPTKEDFAVSGRLTDRVERPEEASPHTAAFSMRKEPRNAPHVIRVASGLFDHSRMACLFLCH